MLSRLLVTSSWTSSVVGPKSHHGRPPSSFWWDLVLPPPSGTPPIFWYSLIFWCSLHLQALFGCDFWVSQGFLISVPTPTTLGGLYSFLWRMLTWPQGQPNTSLPIPLFKWPHLTLCCFSLWLLLEMESRDLHMHTWEAQYLSAVISALCFWIHSIIWHLMFHTSPALSVELKKDGLAKLSLFALTLFPLHSPLAPQNVLSGAPW